MNPSHQTYTLVDTRAPLDFVAKNGYYTVGQEIYIHKILALQAATKTGLPVQWHFADEVFDKLDWRQSSNISLADLYRLRAEQLRQKYRYLILAWSGGGDSTTILDTFLNNNIPLDEVVIMWPHSQTRGRYTPSTDISNENMLSEWDYAIEPKLRWLETNRPDIRVTICDMLANPDKNEFREDTVLIAEKHNYVTIQRWRELDQVIKQRVDQHSDVATILGVSPADIVMLDHGYLATWFQDQMTAPGSRSDLMSDGCPRNIEFFYWTPDMPEIVKEQAHVMLRYLNLFPESRRYVTQMRMNANQKFNTIYRADFEQHRRFRKKLLYPTYPSNTFQVLKQNDTHDRAEWFAWFYDNPHSEEYLRPWRSAIESHQRLIDPGFFHMHQGRIAEYKVFQTRFHIIGRINNEIPLSTQRFRSDDLIGFFGTDTGS